jgi:hypothetical protein
MIGKAIYNLLSNDATVSGYVSNRIYPFMAIEQVVAPYIVYTQETLEPHNIKDGVSPLDVITYHVEVWHENPETVKVLADAVRDVLDRYSGTVQSLNIQSVKYNDEEFGYADADRIFLIMQSYTFRLVK